MGGPQGLATEHRPSDLGDSSKPLCHPCSLPVDGSHLDPNHQVWPLTQSYSVSIFCKIVLDLPGQGKSIIPLTGRIFSLSFLPALPLAQSWSLQGLFELTWHPSLLMTL